MPRDLTLHDVATILGHVTNPTPWELWNILKGNIDEPPNETAANQWRRILRPQIIRGVAERYRANLTPFPAVDPPRALVPLSGALNIANSGDLPVSRDAQILLVRQVSADAFDFNWKNQGVVQAPNSEQTRAQIFLEACGARAAALFVLVGAGAAEHIVEIPRNPALLAEIKAKVEAFRHSLETGDEPAPDYVEDWRSLQLKYPPDNPEPLDLTNRPDIDELVAQLVAAQERKKKGAAEERAGKTECTRLTGLFKAILGNHASAHISGGQSLVFTTLSQPPKQTAGWTTQVLNVVPTNGAVSRLH